MELNLKLNLDNAAFEDTNELSRIFKALAARFETTLCADVHNVLDSNGNTIGYYEITT